jgi:DNA-binding transcriptional ArsR family regulator
MDKIRGNPHAIALAHPTRAQLYSTLCATEEMSTVGLEKAVGVTRYHLYHHLAQLAKLDLVENHRDVGRAKWWRADQQDTAVLSPGVSAAAEGQSHTAGGPAPAWSDSLPVEMVRMLELGAKVEFLPLPKGAANSISAKNLLKALAQEHGIDLDIPFTFVPGGIVLISQPR